MESQRFYDGRSSKNRSIMMKKILFFGDSITALRKNVVVASELFALRYPQYLIVNKGVPGNDTGLARERFQRDVLEERPDVLIFSFGCNDAAIDVYKGKNTPRLPIETYLANLKFFIDSMHPIGTKMIFFTPPPMVLLDNLKPCYGGEPYLSKGFNFMLDQFIAAAKKLMAAEQIPVADVNAAFRAETGGDEKKLAALLPDGMHPNSAGQEIIFRLLCQVISMQNDSMPM